MSWQMRALASYLRVTRKRRWASAEGGVRAVAREKGPSDPPRRTRRRCEVTTTHVGEGTVHTVLARSALARRPGCVVYLHGGAYVSEIAPQHWDLVADLAETTGCAVHVPIYGLAPEHDALDAHEFLDAFLDGLPGGETVHLAGDSAGGGLALAVAQRRVERSTREIAGLTLIAPWLDLTMANPGIEAVEQVDPWLARAGLRAAADAWAGVLTQTDPRVSPLNGNLDRLPPTLVLVGTRDITLPDCRLLQERAPGVVRLVEEPGAVHVYPLLPLAPEASRGRAAIREHVQQTLSGSAVR